MDQGVVRWFGYLERMEEKKHVRRANVQDVRGKKREKPKRGWVGYAKVILYARGIDIQRARE